MFSLYIQPSANFLPPKRASTSTTSTASTASEQEDEEPSRNHRDPIAFLYYSIVLTTLTVIVAIVIGVIQLLTMIQSAARPTGKFWDGVETAGDYYDVIGGGICGCFIVFGILSVVFYKRWRRWVAKRHGKDMVTDEEGGVMERYHDDIVVGTENRNDILDEEAGGSTEVVGKGTAASHVTQKPAGQGQSQAVFLE